jgi:hypothetical protein
MDILMIRRRNFYGIFLRMIHHLLWMSRHQKRGDLPADLQRAVGGKDLPDPTPKMKILSNGILEVSRSIILKLPYWFKTFYQ